MRYFVIYQKLEGAIIDASIMWNDHNIKFVNPIGATHTDKALDEAMRFVKELRNTDHVRNIYGPLAEVVV